MATMANGRVSLPFNRGDTIINKHFTLIQLSPTTLMIVNVSVYILSCQPRVTVALCFVYNVIMDLSSIDHL